MARWISPLTVCRKRAAFWVLEAGDVLLDLFYPPLCRLCSERTRHLFCTSCQDLLAPIHPLTRCRHCFRTSEEGICPKCTHSPELSAPRAFLFEPTPAAFRLKSFKDETLIPIVVSLLIVQFSHLGWETPDRIAAVLPPHRVPYFQKIVDEFAKALGQEAKRELKLVWSAPFQREFVRKSEDLLEEQNLLLVDLGSDVEWLRSALSVLSPAFPKNIKILSLFEH